MYNNVGKQIKNLASTITIIEAIAAVVIGIVIAFLDFEYMWWIGLIIIVGGIFVAWLSNLILYAFGELVDKTSLIEGYLNTSKVKSAYSNQKTASANEWKCSKCGAINQNYVGTCGCGQLKLNN